MSVQNNGNSGWNPLSFLKIGSLKNKQALDEIEMEPLSKAKTTVIAQKSITQIPHPAQSQKKLEQLESKVIPNSSAQSGSSLSKIADLFETREQEPPNVPFVKKEQALEDLVPLTASAKELRTLAIRYMRNQNVDSNPTAMTNALKLFEKAARKAETENNFPLAFQIRSEAAQRVELEKNHPMNDLAAVLQDGKIHHFSALDTGAVRGGNMQASLKTIDGQPTICFDLKLTRPEKLILDQRLKSIENNQTEFNSLLPFDSSTVNIKAAEHGYLIANSDGTYSSDHKYVPAQKKTDPYGNKFEIKASAKEYDFKEVGKVIISDSKEFTCLRDKISIQIPANAANGDIDAAIKMQQLLTVLGCGPVATAQRPADDERLKISHLFRTFYPKEAFQLERGADFYNLPVDELRAKIAEVAPESKAIFKKYLVDQPHLLQKEEIFPGKTAWSIGDLGEQLRQKGAYGLFSGVGDGQTAERAAHFVSLMVKNGAQSSETRFESGTFVAGASSNADLITGGGDRTFTRMVTKNTPDDHFGDFSFYGQMQILYDLDCVNRGAYGFYGDKFGCRSLEPGSDFFGKSYAQRDNLIDYAAKVYQQPQGNNPYADPYEVDTEVMIKNAISPKYMRGVSVSSEADKKILIDQFRSDGLIEKKNGAEYVLGKPLDKFIVVGNDRLKPEYWA